MEVFIQGAGIRDIKDRVFDDNAQILTVLQEAISIGFPAEGAPNAVVFLDDATSPTNLSLTLKGAGARDGSRVHVHVCRQVSVSCNFGAETKSRKFPPNTRIRKVLKKFIERFELDPRDAASYTLLICGTQTEPDQSTQIGALTAYPNCELCFDLVKRENVQG